MEQKKNDPNVTLLQSIYKSVSMGADSVLTLLGKAKKEDLRAELTSELTAYQKFGNITRDKLSAYGTPAEEVGVLQKLPAELSIRMSTITDDSSSKLAELAMNGATMGMIELQKEIKAGEKAGAHHDNIRLAEGVFNLQKESLDKMKHFL